MNYNWPLHYIALYSLAGLTLGMLVFFIVGICRALISERRKHRQAIGGIRTTIGYDTTRKHRRHE